MNRILLSWILIYIVPTASFAQSTLPSNRFALKLYLNLSDEKKLYAIDDTRPSTKYFQSDISIGLPSLALEFKPNHHISHEIEFQQLKYKSYTYRVGIKYNGIDEEISPGSEERHEITLALRYQANLQVSPQRRLNPYLGVGLANRYHFDYTIYLAKKRHVNQERAMDAAVFLAPGLQIKLSSCFFINANYSFYAYQITRSFYPSKTLSTLFRPRDEHIQGHWWPARYHGRLGLVYKL